MIKINTKSDPRMAQTFPNDPFSNLLIRTQTQELHLQLAFLSIDSEYFAGLGPETSEVDLSNLRQQALMRVLHSFYGQPLSASSMSDLMQLYGVIAYLGIDDYISTIWSQIKQRSQLMQSIELLELSYKYKICWQQVLAEHMKNKLKYLEDSKHYLQLSKISNQTFNQILIQFMKKYGDQESKILNNVMENYFNRKCIKPMQYLKQLDIAKLQAIWLKYHHVAVAELAPVPKSTPVIAEEEEEEEMRPRKTTEMLKNRGGQDSIEQKKREVVELENEIAFKDNLIKELNQQISDLKQSLGISNPIRSIKEEMSKPATLKSLLFDADRQPTTPSKKGMRLADLSPTAQSFIGAKKPSEEGQPEEKERVMHKMGAKHMKRS